MYSDYTRKLHFGSVSDGIQAMKDNEFNRITNPMDSQQLSLDSDISKLTASLQSDEASDSVSKTIDDAISGGGGAIESMATMKKLYSKFKDVKDKLSGKKTEESTEGEGEGEFNADTVELPKIEGADLPTPEMPPPGQSFSEEPSEFMDALNNDDFSSLRRMLGMEPKDSIGETDSGFEAPDQLPEIEGGDMAPAPPPDLQAPPAEPVGEGLVNYQGMDTVNEGAETEEPEGAFDELPDWYDTLKLPGSGEYVTGPGAYQGTRPTSNYTNQQGELTDSTNELVDDVPQTESGFGANPISGRAVGSQYDNQQNPSNAPENVEYEEQTLPDEMFHGGGDTEMTTFGHNAQIAEADPSANVDLEQHLSDLQTQESTASKTLTSDTDAVTDAVGEAGEAGADAAEAGADVAENIGVDAAEAGMEAAGTALDATGVGAIVGLVLNIGGIALGAIQGSEDETKDTSVENNIAADQQKVDALKQQELNIKSQISQQTFTGANIIPSISSTTLDNVTSSSF